jgi:hypothetical protein
MARDLTLSVVNTLLTSFVVLWLEILPCV